MVKERIGDVRGRNRIFWVEFVWCEKVRRSGRIWCILREVYSLEC